MCRECQGCGEDGEEDVDFYFGHIKLEVPKVNPDEKEMPDWAGHFEAGTVLKLEHTQGEITQDRKACGSRQKHSTNPGESQAQRRDAPKEPLGDFTGFTEAEPTCCLKVQFDYVLRGMILKGTRLLLLDAFLLVH